MRVLTVKLSSLGDVVHAMPVVHDIRASHAQVEVDWVVEPAFAPMVRRVEGVSCVIECAIRRWRKGWWKASVRKEWRAFRRALGAVSYHAILDLQGLTKSAIIARLASGPSFGLAQPDRGKFLRTARPLAGGSSDLRRAEDPCSGPIARPCSSGAGP